MSTPMRSRMRFFLNLALASVLFGVAFGIFVLSFYALSLGDIGVSIATLGASIGLAVVALVVWAFREDYR